MRTEELVEYLALGEKDASDLLDELNPNLNSRFQRACNSLAKIVDEVRKVYPDANIYLTNDTPNLLIGDSHTPSSQMHNGGECLFEMVAYSSNSLIGKIDGGDW